MEYLLKLPVRIEISRDVPGSFYSGMISVEDEKSPKKYYFELSFSGLSAPGYEQLQGEGDLMASSDYFREMRNRSKIRIADYEGVLYDLESFANFHLIDPNELFFVILESVYLKDNAEREISSALGYDADISFRQKIRRAA